MARSKPTPGSLRAATRKSPSPSAATSDEAAATSSAAVSTEHDMTPPDASVTLVVDHSRQLAALVRRHAAALAMAKVTPAMADQLEAFASDVSARETDYTRRRDAVDLGVVGRARAVLRDGRDQLFEALRAFAEDDVATQRALDDIAGVENDDDLVQDTVRLISLSERHAKDLAGTDVTPARLREVETSMTEFRAARSAIRGDGRPMDAEVLRARAQRNRAFWSLAMLSRTVVKRARYAMRQDESVAALFVSYHAARRRRRKPAPTPATPTPA